MSENSMDKTTDVPEVAQDNGTAEIIEAIQTLVRGATLGQRSGSYNLVDADNIYLAINALSKNKDDDNNLSKSNAINVLIQACNIAQQKGAFNFDEAHTIFKSINALTKDTKSSDIDTAGNAKKTKEV